MVLKKQTAVVHQKLFPFYFILCFQRTWKHSRAATLTNIEIKIICTLYFQGLGFSSLFFLSSFRMKGILVALQVVCVCIKLSLYCRVFQSVMFNLCIHVLYNFHIHMHTHMHINFNFLHIYLFVYIII